MLFVVALMGLLLTLAIPGLMRARGAAQVASALGTMRTINSAQLSYAITCGLGFYSPDLPTLGIKPPAANEAFLGADLAGGPTFIKSGYTFSMAGTPPCRCAGDVQRTWPRHGIAGLCGGCGPAGSGQNNRFFGTNADGHGLRAHRVACGIDARERAAGRRRSHQVTPGGFAPPASAEATAFAKPSARRRQTPPPPQRAKPRQGLRRTSSQGPRRRAPLRRASQSA